MIAQRAKDAMIEAVEINQEACQQAAENMLASPWSSRLNAVCDAIQEFAKNTSKKYDLIVSNPPFFSGGTFSNAADRNEVRHTIKLPNGDLLAAVRSLLSENGKFCVILPTMEGLRFQERAQNYRLYCTKMTEVKPKHDKPVERVLLQFEKSPKVLEKNDLVIQFEKRNHYTDDYISLTGDFYLKM
jgi:tRNA1Val (adenine37-N6)-methyltransferase